MAEKLSKYESVADAVASGDQVEMVKAQVDSIAAALDNTNSARDIATLHTRLSKTLADLRELEPPKKETAAAKRKREAEAKKNTK